MASRKMMRSDPAALDAAMDDLEDYLKNGQGEEVSLELAAEDNGVNALLLERCFRMRHGVSLGEWKPPVSARAMARRLARIEALRWAAHANDFDELFGRAWVPGADMSIPAGSIISVNGNELALCYLLSKPLELGGATLAAVPVGDVDWNALCGAGDERTRITSIFLLSGDLKIFGLQGLTLPELQDRLQSMIIVPADQTIED